MVRSQDPADADRAAQPIGQPPAPVSNPEALPPAIPDLVPAPPDFSPDLADGPSPVLQPAAPVQTDRQWPWGISSITRNRLANRVTGGSASGLFAPGSPGARITGFSSILRNRLTREFAAGEEVEYAYPNIHADPAQIYRDRYGVTSEENDRFLFPWIMNLIFEDRWLLAERNPTTALQNQLRHRLKVDIRDPDPDTANFPNGAYTLAKGRMYIETSPVGFYGPSRNAAAQYSWNYLLRYGLTDNLEFRIFSNGLTATQGKHGTVGVSPLAFDFKVNFWEENTRYSDSGDGNGNVSPDDAGLNGIQQRHPAVDGSALRPDIAVRIQP